MPQTFSENIWIIGSKRFKNPHLQLVPTNVHYMSQKYCLNMIFISSSIMTITIKNKKLGPSETSYPDDEFYNRIIAFKQKYDEETEFLKSSTNEPTWFNDHTESFKNIEKHYHLRSGILKELYQITRLYIGRMEEIRLFGIKFKPVLFNREGEFMQQNFVVFIFEKITDPNITCRSMMPIDADIEYHTNELKDHQQFF